MLSYNVKFSLRLCARARNLASLSYLSLTISRSCLSWLTMLRSCMLDALSRRRHGGISTYIHVTHTVMACSTLSHHCMGHAAKWLVFQVHHLICALFHRD